ncbi:MAG: PaaI family thioesterase [Gemmobacter sp.]
MSETTDTGPTFPLSQAQAFIEALPHARALDMRIEACGAAGVEMSMAWDARFVGDPETGVIHGGAVSALMDTAAGTMAMFSRDPPAVTATLGLRIDYMRSATPGERVRCRAVCFHRMRSVAFIRVTAWDDDAARPVATATGSFTLDPLPGARR